MTLIRLYLVGFVRFPIHLNQMHTFTEFLCFTIIYFAPAFISHPYLFFSIPIFHNTTNQTCLSIYLLPFDGCHVSYLTC